VWTKFSQDGLGLPGNVEAAIYSGRIIENEITQQADVFHGSENSTFLAKPKPGAGHCSGKRPQHYRRWRW
jgi:hypothetical protein